MLIPVDSLSASIENIAEINYIDSNSKPYKGVSNQASTLISSITPIYAVDLLPSFSSVEGISGDRFNFPIQIDDKGNVNDSYTLNFSNLPTGLEPQIYKDINGNGIIDPEDTLIPQIPCTTGQSVCPFQFDTESVKYDVNSPIILSILDKVGLPENSTINFNLNAISKASPGVSTTEPLTIKIIPVPAYRVGLNPKISQISGQSFGTWNFPVNVNNEGKSNDTYKLNISDLPNGIIPKIYQDINGNGLIDPEDTLMTQIPCAGGTGFTVKAVSSCFYEVETTNIPSKDKWSVIISLTDTIGVPANTKIDFNFSAVSKTNTTVNDSTPLSVLVKSNNIPTQNPVPSPSSSVSPPGDPAKFKASLKKTVFPNGVSKAGDVLTYYLEFTNENSFIAKDVVIEDKLPSGLVMINTSGSEPVTSNDGLVTYSSDGTTFSNTFIPKPKTLRFSWSSVNAYETVTAYFKAKIDDNVENGNLQNIAAATYKTGETSSSSGSIQTTNLMSNMAVNIIKNEYLINGTIYDKKTGLPKEGIIVTVYDTNGKEVGKDITGKTGTYRIPVNSKGDYKVIYSDSNGNVLSQNTTTVTKAGDNPAPVEIKGKVMDSQTKEVIANADLKLLDGEGKEVISIKTDAEGNFIFDKDSQGKNLQPGRYIIRVVNAKGQTSYARVNVSLSAGDMVVNLEVLIDPFGVVYDEYGGNEVRIKGAQVKLLRDCNDPNSLVKLDEIDGTAQNNPVITDDKGLYQYFLNQDQLNNKSFCLDVSAEGYKGKKFFLRTAPSKETTNRYVLEITDTQNAANKTLIRNIETIPYNVPLTPIKTFDLTKGSNKSSIEVGEVVTYTIETKNKLKFRVDGVKLNDQLPFGFKYVPDSLKVNGNFVKGFDAVDKLNIDLGDMDPEEKAVIMYQTRTGIRTNEGPSVNTAYVQGNSPKKDIIKSDTVKATVFVKKGIFSKNGALIGKVYVDENNNGIQDTNEPGVPNVAVYTAGGIRVLTDSKGKYSIPDIQDGDLAVLIDLESLPKDLMMSPISQWIGQDDRSQRIFIPESGLAKANFRLVKVPKEKPPEVVVVKENSLKAVYVYPDKFSIKKIPYVTYPDIKDHWSREIVEYESGLDIIHGYPDGEFKPARSISRAEATKLSLVALKSFDIKIGTTFSYILKSDANVDIKLTDSNGNIIKNFYTNIDKKAGIHSIYWDGHDDKGNLVPTGKYTFIVNSVNKDKIDNMLSTVVEAIPSIPNYKPSGYSTFIDVPNNHWATNFIKVGTEEKLVTGYPDNKFRPGNFIPRFEMAVIAVKALNLDINSAKEDLPFEDANDVPQWAKKYVYLAYMNGLLPKYPDGKFYPARNISRAEIAQFVNALINKQKIDAKVRGVVEKNEKNINIEGITLDLSKEKEFSQEVNKDYSENIKIEIPLIKLDNIFDEKYLKKDISR